MTTPDPNAMPDEIYVWNGDEVSTYEAETQRFNNRQTKYIRADLAPTSQWRDISTNEFVSGLRCLIVDAQGIPFVGWRYREDNWCGYGQDRLKPTHWMPLPDAPTKDLAAAGEEK